ncbi:MAG: S1 RNA-binding domain-containing protein [Deltaproteobacteria bacterium]|nr:S1 RNA-binding domain-containing protein [Deltaproteobacteria bacterium]
MDHGTKQDLAKGEQVTVTVERILPFGVFVRLEDGKEGYIRRRELSASGDIDPREVVSEGREIKAIVVELPEPGRTLELSHRATLPDPWEEFVRRFREGDVVEGTVKDLRPYGVFVEILPGVDGLVLLAELVPWEVEKPDEVVWIGDDVEAVITRINSKKKKVWLSIRRRMEQLATAASILERLSQASDTKVQAGPASDDLETAVEEEPEIEESVGPDEIERVGRILVVEDHDDVRLPLVEWFRQRGYQADGVKTAVEALNKIRQQAYGILFVDIDLPEADGLSLIRQLRTQGNKMYVVVMSMAEWLAERMKEIEELEVAAVLLKPLDLDEIERLLARVGRGEALTPIWKPLSNAPEETEIGSFQRLARVMRSSIPLAGRLQIGLENVVRFTRAEVGLVFHMDPTSRIVSIAAQVGTASLNQETIYSLEESPVKDVIQEGRPVFESRVSEEAKGRFSKLLDLLPFESCIGVPIGACGETHHAFFLFHREPEVFSRYRLRDAQAAATLFAVALESQALEERIQSVNRILLSGQLATGFGHEVYNKISGLEIQLRNLQSNCERLTRQVPNLGGSSDFRETKQALDGVLGTAMDLKYTVGLFQRLMRAEEEQELSVNEVVRQAEAQLRPLARKEKAKIKITLDPDLPTIPGSAIRLQQVFLNVMLNAVQHMTLKSKSERTVRVTTAYEASDGAQPVKVRLSDTGPGIHKRLWDKVFALGYSTRPGGTGLGLFIAQSLVESMGGRIIVERSVIPIGTTFLIELPIAELQEEVE